MGILFLCKGRVSGDRHENTFRFNVTRPGGDANRRRAGERK